MAVGSIATRGRAVRRSWTQTTVGSWITTSDHKRIGILYIYTGFIYFLLGGLEAALIRAQLLAQGFQFAHHTLVVAKNVGLPLLELLTLELNLGDEARKALLGLACGLTVRHRLDQGAILIGAVVEQGCAAWKGHLNE